VDVTVEVYKSRRPVGRQRLRWRAVAANGRKLATSGEAYTNAADVVPVLAALFGDRIPVEWRV
jgi:hypothetical protein